MAVESDLAGVLAIKNAVSGRFIGPVPFGAE